MGDDAYESILCVKSEVLVYKIGARPSARGYKAQDWNLDNPDWTGRLKIVSIGSKVFLKLEDRESGKLYAQCPVESFPSAAIEPVLDSSRFFVVKITDESGARTAFVGMGFRDRADSFDMNVSLQDHFKGIKREAEAKASVVPSSNDSGSVLTAGPKLDLGFRAGESITIKMGGTTGKTRDRPSGAPASGGILLPPPPPPGSRVQHVRPASGVPPPAGGNVPKSGSSGNMTPPQQPPQPQPQPPPQPSKTDDLLGLDFGSSPQQKTDPVPEAQQANLQPWIEF